MPQGRIYTGFFFPPGHDNLFFRITTTERVGLVRPQRQRHNGRSKSLIPACGLMHINDTAILSWEQEHIRRACSKLGM